MFLGFGIEVSGVGGGGGLLTDFSVFINIYVLQT